mgnify:CR=1 FL=1
MPILRDSLPEDVTVSSWINDIDYRTMPIVNIRRLGGTRARDKPRHLDNPVIELTVFGDVGLVETEDLYIEALEALYSAARSQTLTPKGRISYVRETMGMTQFSSLIDATWRVQGLIQLGIRPPN